VCAEGLADIISFSSKYLVSHLPVRSSICSWIINSDCARANEAVAAAAAAACIGNEGIKKRPLGRNASKWMTQKVLSPVINAHRTQLRVEFERRQQKNAVPPLIDIEQRKIAETATSGFFCNSPNFHAPRLNSTFIFSRVSS
jgi:hypothetical protein